jgi:hypothetical protein
MINYKYNELAYAELVFKKGFQTKHIPTELRLLVLYLRDEVGMKPKEREVAVYQFCKKHITGFKKENFFKKINKALKSGLNKEQKLIVVLKIDIYNKELEYINSFEIPQEYKKVMFAFLVQNRLNKAVYEYKFNKVYSNISFKGGIKKYNNIKKMSNIPIKMLLNDEVINELDKLKLVTILHKGMIILNYIENCIQEDEVIMTVTDFENVGMYLDCFNNLNGVKKCAGENCDKNIKITNNKNKYCSDCAREIKMELDRQRMQEVRNSRK